MRACVHSPRTCSAIRSARSSLVRCHRRSARLHSTPSPEQGASSSTRSNRRGVSSYPSFAGGPSSQMLVACSSYVTMGAAVTTRGATNPLCALRVSSAPCTAGTDCIPRSCPAPGRCCCAEVRCDGRHHLTDTSTLGGACDQPQPRFIDVHRHDGAGLGACLHAQGSKDRLATRRSARVEQRLARLRVHQRHHQARALVLHGTKALLQRAALEHRLQALRHAARATLSARTLSGEPSLSRPSRTG